MTTVFPPSSSLVAGLLRLLQFKPRIRLAAARSHGEGETIVLEPYAPNILRVTLSMRRQKRPGRRVTASSPSPTRPAGRRANRRQRSVQFRPQIVSVNRPHPIPKLPAKRTVAGRYRKYFNGSAPGAHIVFSTPDGKTAAGDERLVAGGLNHKDGTAQLANDRRPSDPQFLRGGRDLRFARRRALLRPGPEPGGLSRSSRPHGALLERLPRDRRPELLRAVPGDQQGLRAALGQPFEDHHRAGLQRADAVDFAGGRPGFVLRDRGQRRRTRSMPATGC